MHTEQAPHCPNNVLANHLSVYPSTDLIPYEGAKFGASSRWSDAYEAANAFSTTSKEPWHSLKAYEFPQLIYVTFPTKQTVAEISFMPRRDKVEEIAVKQAPKQFEIWATNEEIPRNGDAGESMDATFWQKLAIVDDIVDFDWGSSGYVRTTAIARQKRGLFSTYGICVKSVPDKAHAVMARITLRGERVSECHP